MRVFISFLREKLHLNPPSGSFSHLAFVPGFCFCPAPAGSVLVLSLDISNDAVQVEVPAVVHLYNHLRI